MENGENACNQHLLLSPLCFFYSHQKQIPSCKATFELSSANSFNLRPDENLSSDKDIVDISIDKTVAKHGIIHSGSKCFCLSVFIVCDALCGGDCSIIDTSIVITDFLSSLNLFMPPYQKIGGGDIVLPLSFCPSVCLSAQT